MSQNTLAEYRNLYRDRHGIECPLSDSQVRDAMASASVLEDEWPLNLDVLTEMEALVDSEFPEVNQSRWMHGGTLLAPQNLALDNETAGGFDVNFSLPTGGNEPYSIQLQLASSAVGPWTNEGAAQADNTEIVVTGLSPTTEYFARVVVTDNVGEAAVSNVDSTTTSGT